MKSIGDEDKSGQALLFLNQVEKNFIDYLQGSHVQVHELKFNLNQIAFIQPQVNNDSTIKVENYLFSHSILISIFISDRETYYSKLRFIYFGKRGIQSIPSCL